jgi:hypothetical protein
MHIIFLTHAPKSTKSIAIMHTVPWSVEDQDASIVAGWLRGRVCRLIRTGPKMLPFMYKAQPISGGYVDKGNIQAKDKVLRVNETMQYITRLVKKK